MSNKVAQTLFGELLEAKAEIVDLRRKLARYEKDTLSRALARELHRDLGKLGLKSEEHYTLAEKTLDRKVKSFTSLTEGDAQQVKQTAERVARMRRHGGPASPISDEEAFAILGEAA